MFRGALVQVAIGATVEIVASDGMVAILLVKVTKKSEFKETLLLIVLVCVVLKHKNILCLQYLSLSPVCLLACLIICPAQRAHCWLLYYQTIVGCNTTKPFLA